MTEDPFRSASSPGAYEASFGAQEVSAASTPRSVNTTSSRLVDRLRQVSEEAKQKRANYLTTRRFNEIEKLLIKAAGEGKTEYRFHSPLEMDLVELLQKRHGITYVVDQDRRTHMTSYLCKW